MIKGEVDVHSEQYKGADVSVRLDLVTMATKHSLIGILSLTGVNTVTSLTEVGSRKSFRGKSKSRHTVRTSCHQQLFIYSKGK